MLFGSDGLANFFMFVFLFGLIFTIASLLLGFAHVGGLDSGHSGAGGHGVGGHQLHVNVAGHHANIELDSHPDLHVHGANHDGPGILNMPTMMAFLTWFGGAGYIFRQSFQFVGLLAVPMALISGLAGGAIMSFLLTRVLWPMMTKPMEQEDFTLPGTYARVVSAIRAGGVGEIVYTKQHSRFTAGARGVGGQAISKGADVVIVQYEKGLALVQDVQALTGGDTIAIGESRARVG